jgi:hypothetical protein
MLLPNADWIVAEGDHPEVLAFAHQHRQPISPASSSSVQNKILPPPSSKTTFGAGLGPLPEFLSEETDRDVRWNSSQRGQRDIGCIGDPTLGSPKDGMSSEFSGRVETDEGACLVGYEVIDYNSEYVPTYPWHWKHLTAVSQITYRAYRKWLQCQ